jgi:hypothetical protein
VAVSVQTLSLSVAMSELKRSPSARNRFSRVMLPRKSIVNAVAGRRRSTASKEDVVEFTLIFLLSPSTPVPWPTTLTCSTRLRE